MADETPLNRDQAVTAKPPAPTPPSVEMDEVKSIIGAVDAGNVTGTGDRYLQMAARLDEHAANIVAHAEALAGIWRGQNADNSLETFHQLHTATTAIGANMTAAGETYTWLGATILPFYKSSAQTMTDGFISTDGDDEEARKLLDRMNSRVAEANNGLPSELSVVFPEVEAAGRGEDWGEPGGPGGYPPYTPYADPNGTQNDYTPSGNNPPGNNPSGNDPSGNNPGGVAPGNQGQPGLGTPGGANGPGGLNDPDGLGFTGDLPGNGTDLAGVGPNPGSVPNAFTLDPAGPGIGPLGPSNGSSPYGGYQGFGGLGAFGGPNGGFSTRGPSSFGAPRVGPGQGPRGVIGAMNAEALSARAAQQVAGRGPAGMPIGGTRGGAGGEGEEHTRTTWLSEDEEVWGAESDVPPPVIG